MEHLPMIKTTAKLFHENVIDKLSTIASLLGGFAFTGLTVILTNPDKIAFSDVAFVLTALATFFFIGAAIVGSLYRIFYIRHGPYVIPPVFFIWYLLVMLGICIFLADVALLCFSIGTWVGIASIIVCVFIVAIIFWAWAVTASAGVSLADEEKPNEADVGNC